MKNTFVYAFLLTLVFTSTSCAGRKSRATAETATPTSNTGAKDTTEHIQINGTDRTYMVHVPAGLPADTKSPVLIFIHGGTGNAAHAARTTGVNEAADAHRFIAVYPNGTGTAMGENRRVWNAGNCCAVAVRKNIPDVAFFEMLVKDLLQKYPADAKRIYLTGMSNGGMMTYRLMCELPHLFAAAVPVAGTLGIENCDKGKDIPVFHIHGSADESVQIKGGVGKGLSRTNFRSVPDTLSIVTKPRNCQPPVTKDLAGGDQETTYQCAGAAPVKFRLLKGAGHKWPAGPSGFQAAEEAWNFAKDFVKP